MNDVCIQVRALALDFFLFLLDTAATAAAAAAAVAALLQLLLPLLLPPSLVRLLLPLVPWLLTPTQLPSAISFFFSLPLLLLLPPVHYHSPSSLLPLLVLELVLLRSRSGSSRNREDGFEPAPGTSK